MTGLGAVANFGLYFLEIVMTLKHCSKKIGLQKELFLDNNSAYWSARGLVIISK